MDCLSGNAFHAIYTKFLLHFVSILLTHPMKPFILPSRFTNSFAYA